MCVCVCGTVACASCVDVLIPLREHAHTRLSAARARAGRLLNKLIKEQTLFQTNQKITTQL